MENSDPSGLRFGELTKESFEDASEISKNDSRRLVVLNFKTLQLIRIKALQRELFDLQMKFRLQGVLSSEYLSSRDKLDETLGKYGPLHKFLDLTTRLTENQVKALQNYEVLSEDSLSAVPPGAKLYGKPHDLKEIEKNSKTSTRFQFWRSKENSTTTQYLMHNWLDHTRPDTNIPGGSFVLNTSLEYRELDSRRRRMRSRQHAFSERLSMACFGGWALIAPMLIMTLVPGKHTALITASISTLLFAFILALFADGSMGKDVLAATAAYAAVLVVFVGTSTPSTL
ncbi:hypothetical protein G7Y89_g5973 [Cudoniella acicularis]|uniref:DUF6594 domain-containing protein n=1 Tax=Cudoniella acicularis TaxID=354080 RepID=A0A8H4RMU3_9HELO|nr:hypothetical protein G7Y89_g5973 [Cudoniella acicularis]